MRVNPLDVVVYVVKVLVAGLVAGALVAGVISRLAMFVLAELNEDATALVSDDGFIIGRFTLSGSLNLLLLVGPFLGFAGALAYLVARPLLVGPEWFRWFSLSIPPGVVAGAGIVHPDGVDFTTLDPLWLAIALFIAVPAAFGPILHAVMTRWAPHVPGERWAMTHPLPAWVARGAFAALAVFALVSLVQDIVALS